MNFETLTKSDLFITIVGTFFGALLALLIGIYTMNKQSKNDLMLQRETIELEQKLDFLTRIREDTLEVSQKSQYYTLKFKELQKEVNALGTDVENSVLNSKMSDRVSEISQIAKLIQEYCNNATIIGEIYNNKNLIESAAIIRGHVYESLEWIAPIKFREWNRSDEELLIASDEITNCIFDIDTELSEIFKTTMIKLIGTDNGD